MFNIISTLVVATAFAIVIMLLVKINEIRLSLRGRRLVFIAALLVGAFLAQAVVNVFYTCDSKNVCRYTWGNDPLITNGKGK